MGWPPLIEKPKLEVSNEETEFDHTRYRVKVQVAPKQTLQGYLLVPKGTGPFPRRRRPLLRTRNQHRPNPAHGGFRDYGLQLARRGFVTLSIGSPGGDARKPDTAGTHAPAALLPRLRRRQLLQRPGQPARGRSASGSASSATPTAASGRCSPPACTTSSPAPSGPTPASSSTRRGRTSTTGSRGISAASPGRQQRKPGMPTPENPRTGAYKTDGRARATTCTSCTP